MLFSCMQTVLASNLELFRAQEKKNKECQQLQQDMEMKDAQIASLEEARKKDEGDKKLSLPSFHPTSFSFPTSILVVFSFYL